MTNIVARFTNADYITSALVARRDEEAGKLINDVSGSAFDMSLTLWSLELWVDYSATSNNMDVGALAIDGWDVTFGTAKRELGLAVLNVTAINGQCTNHHIACIMVRCCVV